MITMTIILTNGIREYRKVNSVWAGCLIGCKFMETCGNIETIFVSDTLTGEVYKQLIRG